MKKRQWQLMPPAPPEFLRTYGGLPPLIAQILYNRNIIEPERIRAFLKADPAHLNDPYLLPDMEPAVARLKRAMKDGQTIAVYGDYDLDGISATALLVKGLVSLGADAIPYIPHRLNGGYGLKLPALKKLRQKGADLIVSVDCGVTAISEVAAANEMGLDIIITDHHIPRLELPAAVAVVDPKVPGAVYPCRELTGAGIAFKLLEALWRDAGYRAEPEEYYDLAALGTVADIAPILDENRYLVRRGLDNMNTNPRPGIKQMMARAGLKPGSLGADSISWVLAPRLNAVGRLGHAMASYKILVTDDEAEAETLSAKLEKRNRQRQDITVDAQRDALEQVVAKGLQPLLFAASPDYAAGIVGLVAGRLADEYYRPAVMVSIGKEISHGSCRSVPGFNIEAALSQCAHLLEDYGGHKQAAGFSLKNERLEEFEHTLLEVARRELEGIELKPEIRIDSELDLAHDGEAAFRAVFKLAPFGAGNPSPVFISRNLKVVACDGVGKKQEHLRLRLAAGDRVWEAMAFRAGERRGEVGSRIDIVYNLEIDWWKGVEKLRLLAQDFAPSV